MKNCMAILSFLLFFVETNACNACTQEEAFNKMMILGKKQTEMMAKGLSSDLKKLSKRISGVAPKLQERKYSEACAEYDKIAKDFNIDLKAESQHVVSLEEIKKDGGSRGGVCSQAKAHEKYMKMMEQLESKKANGDIDLSVISAFTEDTKEIGAMIHSNPSSACKKLDNLKEKYKL